MVAHTRAGPGRTHQRAKLPLHPPPWRPNQRTTHVAVLEPHTRRLENPTGTPLLRGERVLPRGVAAQPRTGRVPKKRAQLASALRVGNKKPLE